MINPTEIPKLPSQKPELLTDDLVVPFLYLYQEFWVTSSGMIALVTLFELFARLTVKVAINIKVTIKIR